MPSSIPDPATLNTVQFVLRGLMDALVEAGRINPYHVGLLLRTAANKREDDAEARTLLLDLAEGMDIMAAKLRIAGDPPKP